MDALIIADGEVPPRSALQRLLADQQVTPGLVVAADGGALKAESLGLVPDVVVGDFDSLPAHDVERLRNQGVPLLTFPPDKDESDAQLAMREALSRGADRLLLLGALGGRRVEHSLANVLLLTMPELSRLDAAIVHRATTLRAISAENGGRLEVRGAAGDYVSLLPLSECVEGVTTTGLAYELHDEELLQGPARGLSNELAGTSASVSTTGGRLLVVHTRRAEA